MTRPVRVLISKIGLDGHDRGAKLIVRNLRDSGMEVIYTGLWQSPLSTVHAAVQEDVDVIGVSLLSAAHMTIIPELRRLCDEFELPRIPLTVGGIIPEEDKAELSKSCDGIFNPGSSMQSIVSAMRELAARYRADRDAQRMRFDLSRPTHLARALTLITENRDAEIGPLPASQRASVRIGITGAPGVGKSTFIGKLATQLVSRNRRVAVVAVDPTSPITGGSVLGDRLRMMTHQPDPRLFVRSLSSGGAAGGLAPRTEEIVNCLQTAGFEIVLIETVGAGQNDVEVRKLAQDVLLLLMPGAGDSVQFQKAGVVEIATGFVLNKADLEGADHTIHQLRESVDDGRPIWSVSALRNEGFAPLCDWIEARLNKS